MTKNYIVVFTLIAIIIPTLSRADNDDVRSETEANVSVEQKFDLRKTELQHRLWKQEVEDTRSDYHTAREAYQHASADGRKTLLGEFRTKFVGRFMFAYETLVNFQTRMDAKLEQESDAGVDTRKAQVKLDESISFMASIKTDIESLRALVMKDHTEAEREAKKEEVKTLIEKIKTNIKASHMALRESFKELRAAKAVKVEANATIETSVN